MPIGIIAPIIQTAVRTFGRYVYQGLRVQDKLVDATYRQTGLYNRGVVRGIKHGLAGGQIIGGTAQLGLYTSGQDTDYGIPQRKNGYSQTNKQFQTYNRRKRYYGRNKRKCRPYTRRSY